MVIAITYVTWSKEGVVARGGLRAPADVLFGRWSIRAPLRRSSWAQEDGGEAGSSCRRRDLARCSCFGSVGGGDEAGSPSSKESARSGMRTTTDASCCLPEDRCS